MNEQAEDDAPTRGTVGQEIFERVEQLMASEQITRTEAFQRISDESGRRAGTVAAVDRVSLDIRKGEIVGLVGESGCGKSTLGKAMLRMTHPGRISGGELWFDGVDLLTLSEKRMRELRGARLGMVLQDPHLFHDTVAANPRAANAWMHTPNDAGYPHFAGALYNVNSHPAPVERPDYYSWYRVENGEAAMNSTYTTIVQADDAIDFIQAGPEPFFLYLPWTAIHGPFNWPPNELHSYGPKPPDGDGEDGQPFAANTRARAMLETLDREIGRVLASMTPEVARRTMIVVIGDNGTEKSVLEIEA